MSDLENMTAYELRAMADDLGLSYRKENGSRMNKAEIRELIANHMGEADTVLKEDLPAPEPEKPKTPPKKAAAPKPAPKPKAPEPPSGDYFMVVGRHRYANKDGMHTLHHGAIVSAKTHDMESIRAQKVTLGPCEAPGPKPDLFGRMPDSEWGKAIPDPRMNKPEEPVSFGMRDGRKFIVDQHGNRQAILEEDMPGGKNRPFRIGSKVV